ncbi:benzoate/H(+) symporter BenE family transporter [Solirubrobacter phytolaccae]|uniref:Benzoate/H(+) symporter BenE family transporter n=1 Tax=Solirubrobacter phytolaccae TaxID=1404360 RepID=A0A9X3N6M2_9ACTN|nr:benzoate/H(+) symporter BenE family transporter [Solirubrobacter phytolaccae]MDA0179287.1 benzoate/H(+) symporter BenE family transporter [Solirubrobacter phytolaccae]
MERTSDASAHTIVAGIMAALVGFTSSFAVVLSGLRAAGASPAEAASGLLAVTVTMAVATLLLSRHYRMPLLIAWSTPGAALLASTGTVDGGWPAAIGAFLICGGLIMATGIWPRLGALITSIPTPIAQAMLAGIVLQLCLTPVRELVAHPWQIAPILLVWLVVLRLAPKWAIPAAFVAALAVIGVDAARGGGVHGDLLPQLQWTTPHLTWAGVLSLALPLYVVTMAGQNVPGTAILASYGYRVPWRSAMVVTGAGTALGAGAGGHAINLAAISATLVIAPEVDPDPRRRWTAAMSAGWAYLVLALLSTALATLVSAAPADVAGAVAGLALLGALGSALSGATSAEHGRDAAAITFVVAASGVSFFAIGAAFWALLAGVGTYLVTRRPQA